ncbi:MAG: sigma-70 family RNA polymerase sigma factor [Zetaproteobacteria bacterium]|nr:MAG: sigma-70 family RNA polymerase sigma factor [Zetaproteobacteria bacterium]
MDESPHRWLEEHGDALFAYAMRQVGDRDQAADLVQETLLAGWRNREGFDGRARVRTWLTGILRHKIADRLRRVVRERAFVEDAREDPTDPWFAPDGAWLEAPSAWRDDPAALLERNRLRAAIEECVARLPERSRLLFCAREFSGEEREEICKRMGISTTNFHVVMHRARLALRRCLEARGVGV